VASRWEAKATRHSEKVEAIRTRTSSRLSKQRRNAKQSAFHRDCSETRWLAAGLLRKLEGEIEAALQASDDDFHPSFLLLLERASDVRAELFDELVPGDW
jgi:hypothetical protein